MRIIVLYKYVSQKQVFCKYIFSLEGTEHNSRDYFVVQKYYDVIICAMIFCISYSVLFVEGKANKRNSDKIFSFSYYESQQKLTAVETRKQKLLSGQIFYPVPSIFISCRSSFNVVDDIDTKGQYIYGHYFQTN